MSDHEESEIDFEEQIRLHELEKQGKLPSSEASLKTKIIDGTEYEWDQKQNAWVPKMTEDFIAMYQASYGVNTDENGKYTYIDPTTKRILNFNSEENKWYYKDTNMPVEPMSLSANSLTDNVDPNVEYDKERLCYVYKDLTRNILYEFDQATQEWLPQKNPKMQNKKGKKIKKQKSLLENKEQKLTQAPPKWFEMDDSKNTNVYVSNLPEDITIDEFTQFMSKCGIILEDPQTKSPKIKLYTDSEGKNKGDGRCCYLKPESVALALQILDGTNIRGCDVKVEKAKFELKGAYNPSLKPKKIKPEDKKQLQKAQAKAIRRQQKLLEWKPDPLPGQRFNREKTIILKNVFDPKIFDADASLILQYQKDIKSEVAKYGQVKKLKIYDRHPEGIVSVTFNEFDEADACFKSINGRLYAGRIISAEYWDGRTKYKINETEEEEQHRLKQWGEFLEGDNNEDSD